MQPPVNQENEIYLMNFLFDYPLSGSFIDHKGQFCEEEHNPSLLGGATNLPALERSRNWLKLEGTHIGPLEYFSPTGRSWVDHGEISTSTLLIRRPQQPAAPLDSVAVSKQKGAGVLIRLAPTRILASRISASDLKIELAICFGNSDPTLQEFASPFREGQDGPVRTTFIFEAMGPNQLDKSWCFAIGEIQRWPDSPNKTGRYGFALGIRVYGLDEYPLDFSMDPEMDVSI